MIENVIRINRMDELGHYTAISTSQLFLPRTKVEQEGLLNCVGVVGN